MWCRYQPVNSFVFSSLRIYTQPPFRWVVIPSQYLKINIICCHCARLPIPFQKSGKSNDSSKCIITTPEELLQKGLFKHFGNRAHDKTLHKPAQEFKYVKTFGLEMQPILDPIAVYVCIIDLLLIIIQTIVDNNDGSNNDDKDDIIPAFLTATEYHILSKG